MSDISINNAIKHYKNEGMLSLLVAIKRVAKNKVVKNIDNVKYKAESPLFIDDLQTWGAEKGVCHITSPGGKFRIDEQLTGTQKHGSKQIIGHHAYEEDFICEIPNGIVSQKRGLCQTNNGRIIIEPGGMRYEVMETDLYGADNESVGPDHSGYRYGIKNLAEAFSCQKDALVKSDAEFKKYNIVAHLMERYSPPFYGHWINECLPQIRSIKWYESKFDVDVKILVNGKPPSWLIESLKMFGYTDNDLIIWDRGSIKAQKLLIPKKYYLNSGGGNYNPEGKKWVRSRAQEWVSSKAQDEKTENISNPPQYIFVSRESASRRNIINLREVKEALREAGFKILQPEDLNLQEEVQFFSNADIIVGAYGSNLAGMIYSEEATIVDLQPYGYFGYFYYIMANELDLRYTCIHGEPVNQDKDIQPKHQDIHIDINNLKFVINKLKSMSTHV
jgi:capsular polysaccharide biosynthesis protein